MGDITSVRPRGNRLGNLSVRTRIVAAVLVAALVATVVGVLGIRSLGTTNEATADIYHKNLLGFEQVATLRRATAEMRLYVTNHALSVEDAERASYAKLIVDSDTTINQAMQAYSATNPGAASRDALTVFSAALTSYRDLRDTVLIPAGTHHDLDTWRSTRDGKVAPLVTTMDQQLATMVDKEKSGAQAAVVAAQDAYVSNRTIAIVLLVVGLALAIGTGVVVAGGIARGLNRVRSVCEDLEAGDLTVRVGLTTHDELGRMGHALDGALAKLREMVGTIDVSSTSLASAASQLAGASGHIVTSAEETEVQAGVVSAAAEQVSRSSQTVAAGMEEMGASIKEIAFSAAEAARVAGEAVTAAQGTSTTVARLGESSREIGDVVKAITSIAAQTNLLALNATIEAARAGEAGKGFAVVAGEVKELAQETARATENIANRIETIRKDTDDAIEAIVHVSTIITSIDDYQSTIAAAVEEQTATTNEMNRGVSEAATGSGEIAANIASVAQSASETHASAAESQESAATLAALSSELRVLVGHFKY